MKLGKITTIILALCMMATLNGEIGEDVTHNARVFSNLPVSIPFKGELVLRGEGVIPYSEFYRINEELGEDEQYKNPRNLCSGTVRQLNSEIAAKRNVKFFAFTLVSADGKEISDSKAKNMDWLASLGFDVVEHVMVTAETVAAEVEHFRSRIEDNDIASDGLVMTVFVVACHVFLAVQIIWLVAVFIKRKARKFNHFSNVSVA